jgi:glycosyltransferase involved in cell wall biosynthesis
VREKSSKIRVLLLVENNAYPADFRVRREAHALRDAGHEVTVIAPRGNRQTWVERIEGIAVHRFPAPPGGDGVLGYAFEFAYATLAMLALTGWVVMRRGIDVIHAANPPDTLCLIGAVFKLLGKKFVFDQHDLSPETYLSRYGQPRKNLLYEALRFLEYCSYRIADVVIVTNESYKRIALERGRKRADAVFVVRNGPPLSYQPLPADVELTSRATHLIGYVGTIGPQDGLDYWMRAIHELVFTLKRRDFLAVVIGDGDALGAVQELANRLGVEKYVWFTGRLPELETRRLLSSVHICVQPDPLSPLNDKSTMNKLMEYMALGKPTVAFDLTETRYSARDAALYARPNDEREFAGHVSRLLDDPDACARMGESGRQRVATALAWEYSVPELLRAYTEGLGLQAGLQVTSQQ